MVPLDNAKKHVIIIGAGPAGLTAAYELGKKNTDCLVLEKDNTVGGISRTVHYKGYHFDIGGHRFFTKVKLVDEFWQEVLPAEDFLTCKRLSRIYYNKKFFHYPLRASNALTSLGFWNCSMIILSYLKAQLFPNPEENTFDQWVTNRFGKRLYNTFFKTYTEKVWGIPCSEIAADWAAQRIKGLSLFAALKNALIQQNLGKTVKKDYVIKTLIDSFQYPKKGPGMLWETVTEKVREQGNSIEMNTETQRIFWNGSRISAVETIGTEGTKLLEGSDFISSMPIRQLLRQLSPAPPAIVVEAAEKLQYRDFLTVALVVDHAELFPDNWIYIHDPDVQVGRIQNFKNWSPYMVPDEKMTCLGLEYFCFEGDGLWTMSDEDLIALGTKELQELDLARAVDVVDGSVVRMPKAYPVYDSQYQDALTVIREFIDRFENLYPVGRNGMHRYNNQDHSMLTAMLAVQNIHGANYDLWKINDDNNYHEEMREGEEDPFTKDLSDLESTQPKVPVQILVAEDFDHRKDS